MLSLLFGNTVHRHKFLAKARNSISCPQSIQQCYMENRHLLKKIQDTRNTVHRTVMPMGHHRPWDLTQFSQSPSAAPVYFPEFHQWSEISSLSRVIIVLGKARSHKAPNLVCKGAESPGWFDGSPQNSVRDIMHEQACCHDEAATHQLPIASAFWIIQIVSAEECSSFVQNWMLIHCSTCPVILNETATQCTCSFNGAYRPTDKYSEVVMVHTSCAFQSTLLGYQVTSMSHKPFSLYDQWLMAGLFLGRPHMFFQGSCWIHLEFKSQQMWWMVLTQ